MRQLFKTTGFRSALLYLGVFLVSVAILCSVLFIQTMTMLEQEIDNRTIYEIDLTKRLYQTMTRAEFTKQIDRRGRGPSSAVFWLATTDGVKLAGNLDLLPIIGATEDKGDGWIEFYFANIAQPGAKQVIRGRLVELDPDLRLFIGSDVGSRESLTTRSLRDMALVIFLTLILGLFGGAVMGRNSVRRIEKINRTVHKIIEGDLHRRILLRGSDDELDQLAVNLNSMLDRIESLMQSMRDVSDNIAHDLRTPLNRLRSRLDVLTMQIDQNNKVQLSKSELDDLLKSLDEVLDNFNALLSLSRLESKATKFDHEPFDLTDMVRDVASLYQPWVEQTGQKLRIKVDEKVVVIDGNRSLLSQALSNLIENSLKYAPGSDIEICLHRNAENVEMSVVDFGDGIDSKDYARVLKRFERLDASRHLAGSGLGLPLVKAIIERHSGFMRLGRSSPKGLTVSLLFEA